MAWLDGARRNDADYGPHRRVIPHHVDAQQEWVQGERSGHRQEYKAICHGCDEISMGANFFGLIGTPPPQPRRCQTAGTSRQRLERWMSVQRSTILRQSDDDLASSLGSNQRAGMTGNSRTLIETIKCGTARAQVKIRRRSVTREPIPRSVRRRMEATTARRTESEAAAEVATASGFQRERSAPCSVPGCGRMGLEHISNSTRAVEFDAPVV